MNKDKAFIKTKHLAEQNNLSFYKIEKDLGLNNSFFSEWKKGKFKPKVDKLQRIAKYFGVSIEYFIED